MDIQNKHTYSILAALLVEVAGISFFAGMQYQRQKTLGPEVGRVTAPRGFSGSSTATTTTKNAVFTTPSTPATPHVGPITPPSH